MKLITLSNSPASILGLAANQSQHKEMVENAYQGGINYFFFYNLGFENFLSGLKPLLTNQREEILVATGNESRNIKELEQYLDSVRHRLNLDLVDLFLLEYVSPADDLSQIQTLVERLHHWKEQGLIRYLGVSIHNRPTAMKIIEEAQIDVLMHRYNMAHRKAEHDVLPAAQNADIPVVAFTCTRWGSLLKGHQNWQAKIPTAPDCYRYAIANPAVQVALSAPQTASQLKENLQVLDRPELSVAEQSFWQSYGDSIYGDGQDSFDTQWA